MSETPAKSKTVKALLFVFAGAPFTPHNVVGVAGEWFPFIPQPVGGRDQVDLVTAGIIAENPELPFQLVDISSDLADKIDACNIPRGATLEQVANRSDQLRALQTHKEIKELTKKYGEGESN